MKFFLTYFFFVSLLAIFVSSAHAGNFAQKPFEFKLNKRYLYGYTADISTSLSSSPTLYVGTAMRAMVHISQIMVNGMHLNVMGLRNISLVSYISEDMAPIMETLESRQEQILEFTLQYHVNVTTNNLEWIEVHNRDEPWSVNIKKAILEMFLIEVPPDDLQIHSERDNQNHSSCNYDFMDLCFDVHEATSLGKCETSYHINAPSSIQIGNFEWKFTKYRDSQNCLDRTQHAGEQDDCAKDIKIEKINQNSNIDYYIASKRALEINKNGRVIFSNQGTDYISHTEQNLKFVSILDDPVDELNKSYVIRVPDITFSLHPHVGSFTKSLHPEIQIHNILASSVSQLSLVYDIVTFLNQIAETVMESGNKSEHNVADLMREIVSRLAHLEPQYIMQIYRNYCSVSEVTLYTNTLEAVRRQLFLDAVSHVGTRNASEWLGQVLSLNSNGLFPMEIRQVIETLPLNVIEPTISLIELLEKKITAYLQAEDWDSLSAFVITYGELIAKACPNIEVYSESDNKTIINQSRVRTNWWVPEEQTTTCTSQQTIKYIEDLSGKLLIAKSVRGKVLIAQALVHTGKVAALEELESYVNCEFKSQISDISDRAFFRTSVIYSLRHMIAVAPKRIRSLVLPIFNKKTESYEVRLASFTVLMSARPEIHEIYSVADSLQNETNNEIIAMVRSLLVQTANLTLACDQPLAQAAREIVANLPEVNLDGVSSQASYNEWYSTDKSTGFYSNGQYVMKNISLIPRHVYLSIGSYWKSSSNSWFNFDLQQKGLANFLKLFKDKFTINDVDKIENLWKSIEIESQDEEFMLELFVQVYEQSSLFTMDKYTIRNAYEQFLRIARNFFSDDSSESFDFNLVRFYMPSSFTDVVPSPIGLPIVAIKQKNQIISLRLKKSDADTFRISATGGSINIKVIPQIFTTSRVSLSVFNQGLGSEINYGVNTLADSKFCAPANIEFKWSLKNKICECKIKPVYDETNFQSSNSRFAAITRGQSGNNASEKVIYSSLPTSKQPIIKLESMEFGVNLIMSINISTGLSWFSDTNQILYDDTFAWILDKYHEMHRHDHQINLTISPNHDLAETDISFSFNFLNMVEEMLKIEHTANLLRPVLIIPGLASNRLLQSGSSCFDGPRVWYNYYPTRDWNECWVYTIELIYDNVTDTVDDGDGTINLDQFGWTNSMENLITDLPSRFPSANVFRKMVAHLKRNGFVKGKTLYGIPQDWRKSVTDVKSDYYANFYGVLESAVSQTGKKAVVVCHSYGCINLAEFIKRYPKEQLTDKIHKIITLAAPWGGSIAALRALLSGDNLGKWHHSYKVYNLIQRTFTSFVHLLPSEDVPKKGPIVWINAVPYNIYEMDKIFEKAKLDPKLLKSRNKIATLLNEFDKIGDTVSIDCICGDGVETLTSLRYPTERLSNATLITTSNKKGDGTVGYDSLSLCEKKTYMNFTVIKNLNHSYIIQIDSILDRIVEVATLPDE